MTEKIDTTLDAIKRLFPGQEIDCDRAFVSEGGVYVRSGGRWIELRPRKSATLEAAHPLNWLKPTGGLF